MKRFMIVALGVVVLGVGTAVWLAGNAPPATLVAPRPIIAEPPFQYPLELWDRQVEGESVVMVHVTAGGAVDSAYVLRSSGEAAFDSAAVVGARTITFRPGRRASEAVDAWVRLPVRFQQPDTTNTDAPGESDE